MTKIDPNTFTLAANTIRMLSADGVEKAKSGHPGMPMGMADIAASLWLNHMRFNPQDPKWLGRDRFVLSNGHGSMLLYSMLHLCGYDVSMNDLKSFRQWESKTPGHPESFMTPGVETTTGPLGQGIANSVGLAIGQKLMAAKYGDTTFNPFNQQRVYVFCGDGCLQEGVSGEASSIAGHLGLGNLIVIYDDNEISIAGHTDLSFTENVGKRYEGYGWHVQEIDGHNPDEINRAIENAKQQTEKPNFIIAHTIIGKGSPNRANTRHVHGEALGTEELAATRKALNWVSDEMFFVPDEIRKVFAERVETCKTEYAKWQDQFKGWSERSPERAQNLASQMNREVPADLEARLLKSLPTDGKAMSTRKLSETVLQAASANVSALIGGSADLEPSTFTLIKDSTDIEKGAFTGKNLRFGVREHGMGAIMNGLAYYGGFIPYGSTFLCFLDYMRPTVRLAALSHLPGLFIYTHDSIFLGEDGPTHQPIEHLAILRMTPNLWMFRPADGIETAVAYSQALERKDGPSSLIFTRQNLEPLPRPPGFTTAEIRKGAYTVVEAANGKPEYIFVGTGSEASLALEAAKLIGIEKCRVVSMPCSQLFQAQPKAYRDALFPAGVKKVVVETGTSFGWTGLVNGGPDDTLVIGIDHYGASAPANVLAEKFGFTPKQVADRVSKWQ